MTVRWLVVLLTAAALVVSPLAFRARPASEQQVSVDQLVQRIQESRDVAWSGFVQTSGSLQVPDSDSFANLAQLLGEQNDLRVWWRSADDWRVDRIRSTGETDLFRRSETMTRWVFESETATVTPVSTIRLPDASDLLPPTLGRSFLQGVRRDELSPLPARRVAGLDAAGLRLVPRDPTTTVRQVDLWADPETGLVLQVELYGVGQERADVTASLLTVDLSAPDPATTQFDPPASTTINFEESVDVAAEANAFAPFDLPVSLAGLPARSGEDPGAVGIYGRGPTALIAIPLRGRVAWPLRQRLRETGTARETATGTLAPVSTVGLLITSNEDGRSFLLAGTVTSPTLERAAGELLGGR
jgi:hypothetical protein